jgi:hypothetical protein
MKFFSIMNPRAMLWAILVGISAAFGQDSRASAAADEARMNAGKFEEVSQAVLLGGVEAAGAMSQQDRAALRREVAASLEEFKAPRYMDIINANIEEDVRRGVATGRFTPKGGEEYRVKSLGEEEAFRRNAIAALEEVASYLEAADAGKAPFIGPVRERRMHEEGAKLAKAHGPTILKDGATAARKLTRLERQMLRMSMLSQLKNLETMAAQIASAPPGSPNWWPSLPQELADCRQTIATLDEADRP